MGFEHGCWTPFKVHGVGDTPECIREVTVCMMLCTNSARGLGVSFLGDLGCGCKVLEIQGAGCWSGERGETLQCISNLCMCICSIHSGFLLAVAGNGDKPATSS